MKLIYAHSSALQQAFVRLVQQINPGPLARVLVVCPSSRIFEQLNRRLAEKAGAVGGVYFQTFSTLLHTLDAQDEQIKPPLLPADHLQDFILKNVLRRPGLDRYASGRGVVGALKSSLRDMADSLADPEVLEEHLRTTTDARLEQESEHLAWLERVYRAYQQEMNQVPGYRSYQAWFAGAEAQIENSAWLAGFKEIVFYGFYDMTGRQLELLGRVKAHYPVTVFAPYVKHPAYQFAKKFFEANLLGGENEEIPLDSSSLALGETVACLFASGGKKTTKNLSLASAVGSKGELCCAAKEILKLADLGMPFAEMAIIVRSVEAYKNDIASVLQEHSIPWKGTLPFTLKHLPLGVFCLNLFSLLKTNFDRESVLAVVSSPYFKQKNKWRYLINASLVSRDYAQWMDLIIPKTKGDDVAFLSWLENIKAGLEHLNQARPWRELSDFALSFLRQYVEEESLLTPQDTKVYEEIIKAISALSRYEVVRKQAEAEEFLAELTDALGGIEIHVVSDMQAGVCFVDAQGARGLSFKAVFVLGMNEKNFPQVIQEDPILKDYYRYIMRDGLGYWINQKLERFEEEKLLFFNAVTAASEKLFVTYQRTTDEGKVAVPSVYLAELARAAGIDLQSEAVTRLSGRLSERAEQWPLALLTPKELSGVLALSGADSQEYYEQAGLLTPFAGRSLAACKKLNQFAGLNEYDGVISSGHEFFERVNKKGLSPSALQTLGHCPLSYFFSKGLGLKEPDEKLSRQELAPNLRGSAYHQVLRDFYKDLYERHWTGQLFDSALAEQLNQALDKNFPPLSYKTFGIYPVIWDVILQDIKNTLTHFVQKASADAEEFIPSVFETLFEQEYAPSAHLQLHLRGVIDRIDVDEKGKTFRVVDYKSTRKGTKDLRADIFKYLILQPFIYVLLAQDKACTRGLSSAGSCLLNLKPAYSKQTLSSADFDEIKPKADAFLNLLAGFIEKGIFFLRLSDHCLYCPYASICRKDCFNSLLRSRHSAYSQQLEEARQ